MATLKENINQAIADFDSIKQAIEEAGVAVPYDTNTSEYANLIRQAVAMATPSFPVDITLNKTSIELKAGESITLVATILPIEATNKTLTWKSSDENIAKVEDGIVTAISEGNAIIYATTINSLTAECSVIVLALSVIDKIISDKKSVYVFDETGNLVECEFKYITMTEDEAALPGSQSAFYQIVNEKENVIESGYQIYCPLYEDDYFHIALPAEITSFELQKYDLLAQKWNTVNFKFNVDDEQTIDDYTIWVVPEEYEQISDGEYYRFIINA